MKHHPLVKQERTGDKKAAGMDEKISTCQEDGLGTEGHKSNYFECRKDKID